MGGVNILHLSDLHFGVEKVEGKITTSAIQKRERIMGKLLKKLDEVSRNGPEWKPHIVVISGDVGWKARYSDYEQASTWLKDMLKAVSLLPKDMIICSGNHDIDRSIAEFRTPPITSAADANKRLSIENLYYRTPPFNAFGKFCTDSEIVPLHNNAKNPEDGQAMKFLYGYRELNGVHFAVFNSAWNCQGYTDRSNLWIGENLVSDIEIFIDKADCIIISVFHHPFDWLKQAEQKVYANEPAARNSIIFQTSRIAISLDMEVNRRTSC